MRHWHTCGAFGSEVYELSLWDWLAVLFGRELQLGSTVVSVGKSRAVCHPNNYAGSREQQIAKENMWL